MHTQYGEFDIDDLIDEDPPPSTKKLPGYATFEVVDKEEALFYTAEWSLTATVKDPNGKTIIAKSTASSKPHTEPFTKRWTRQVIRSNKALLRKAGVDVDKVYVEWGGLLEDLEETF